MKRFLFLVVMLSAVLLRAELIWSADFKANAKAVELSNGAKIVENNVLDLGYGDPNSKAWAALTIPQADLRAGAMSFRYRPGYDLLKKAASADHPDTRSILFIPAEGSIYTGIKIDWYNTYGAWLHFYLCSNNDDHKNIQTGLHSSNQEAHKFNTKAGEWKKIHVSWTQTAARMWIDGKLVGERTLEEAPALGLPLGKIYFGAANVRGMQLPAADMQIADIKLWNTAETPESVSEEAKTIAVGGPGTQLYASLRKHYPAVYFAQAPVIDGKLNDAVWAGAPEQSGFVKNAVGRQYVGTQSVIKFGWDTKNLYVAGIFMEPHMNNLHADATTRDGAVYKDDAVELCLVPDLKNIQDVFQLIANSASGKYDSRKFDAKWNGNWQAAAQRGKDRWTFEIAVPFADLGITGEQGRVLQVLVGRDRVAGNGVDAISASPEITGSFLNPAEYDYLELQNGKVDLNAAEQKLNKDFIEDTRIAVNQKLGDSAKELQWGTRLASKGAEGLPPEIARLEKEIKDAGARLSAVLNSQSARPADWALTRTALEGFSALLNRHAEEMNRIGFSAVKKLPANLPEGITVKGDVSFVKNKGVTVVVDNTTGMIAGVFNGAGTKLADWSFDLYHAETVKTRRHSDERMDRVSSCEVKDNALVLNCLNQDLGITVTKRYFRPNPDITGGRIISKEIAISGNPAEKTLVTVVSRMHLNDYLTENAIYHRVVGAGVIGEKRSIIPAKEITQPISLYYFFNTSSPSLLCAYDAAKHCGLGHYWFKADGKWVLPGSTPDYVSILNRNGWDMTWFMTFVTPKPVTGEIRIHAFDGDRVKFHSEYRDAPERLAVLDVDKVAPEIQFRRYYLNLGFDLALLDNPETMLSQKFPFIYNRMRSNEYSLALDYENNDLWYGDYPVGDDAVLHLAYPPDSKKTMSGKLKRDRVAEGVKRFPKVLPGWYHTPQNLCYHSQFVKEHPEMLMIGKDGKPAPSNWSPYMGLGNFTPEYWDEVVRRICDQMDYYGDRTVYLDYSVMHAQPDWGNGVVRYSTDHIYFLQKLYKEVHKRHGVLFTNGVTCDGIQDLAYYEGVDKYKTAKTGWRDAADCLMMRALYAREGVRFIPLYWRGGNQWPETTRNYRDYTNMVLSQLVAPVECHHDPYHEHFKNPATGKTNWVNVFAHAVPYFDFSLDVGWTRLANDVDFSPAWWKEETGNLESYVFRKGKSEYIFTALRHEPVNTAEDVTVTADFAKMGFDPEAMTFVWQFWPRDPDKFPRNGAPLPANWDKLFDKIDCRSVAAGSNGRLAVAMPSVVGDLTRLAMVTQVPAVFVALENKPLTFYQPDVLTNTVVGKVRQGEKSYSLTANTVLPGRIWVYLPADSNTISVNGKNVEFEMQSVGTQKFAVVDLAQGASEIGVNMSSHAPEASAAPAFHAAPAGNAEKKKDAEAMKTLDSLKGQPVKLVGFGDSNTDFNHWSFGRNWLVMVGCNGSDFFGRRVIINSGVSGDNTAAALARIQSDVLDFHPDIVIVSLGINDACQRRPMADFRRDYRAILEKLTAGGCYVITRTSQPIINMLNGDEDVECAPEMASYMNAIVELSKEFGVPCVDHYKLWKKSMESKYHGELVLLMGNRLHPNENGHRRLYSELAPYLNLEPDFQNEFTHLLRHQ